MSAVLGIDASWAPRDPTGVALVRIQPGFGWECVVLAPSYEAFFNLAEGGGEDWAEPYRWNGRIAGGSPEPERLLKAAHELLGGDQVSVVAVDMPLSHAPIVGRRECDRTVSRLFGSMGCSTHSPTGQRLREFSVRMTEGFGEQGYQLEVANPRDCTVIEVYPHPALLTLLEADYRLAYKVSRSRKYWPNTSLQRRTENLFEVFQTIYAGLARELKALPPGFIPAPPYPALAFLKRYDDALDALSVCLGRNAVPNRAS